MVEKSHPQNRIGSGKFLELRDIPGSLGYKDPYIKQPGFNEKFLALFYFPLAQVKQKQS